MNIISNLHKTTPRTAVLDYDGGNSNTPTGIILYVHHGGRYLFQGEGLPSDAEIQLLYGGRGRSLAIEQPNAEGKLLSLVNLAQGAYILMISKAKAGMKMFAGNAGMGAGINNIFAGNSIFSDGFCMGGGDSGGDSGGDKSSSDKLHILDADTEYAGAGGSWWRAGTNWPTSIVSDSPRMFIQSRRFGAGRRPSIICRADFMGDATSINGQAFSSSGWNLRLGAQARDAWLLDYTFTGDSWIRINDVEVYWRVGSSLIEDADNPQIIVAILTDADLATIAADTSANHADSAATILAA